DVLPLGELKRSSEARDWIAADAEHGLEIRRPDVRLGHEALVAGRLCGLERAARDHERLWESVAAPLALLPIEQRPGGSADIAGGLLERLVDEPNLELAAAGVALDGAREAEQQLRAQRTGLDLGNAALEQAPGAVRLAGGHQDRGGLRDQRRSLEGVAVLRTPIQGPSAQLGGDA